MSLQAEDRVVVLGVVRARRFGVPTQVLVAGGLVAARLRGRLQPAGDELAFDEADRQVEALTQPRRLVVRCRDRTIGGPGAVPDRQVRRQRPGHVGGRDRVAPTERARRPARFPAR